MPILELRCPCGLSKDAYLSCWQEYGVLTHLCDVCGGTFAPALSVGRGLTYFEEGRARVIENLGGVAITSHEQHKRVMKQRGVEMATDWHTSKKGPGVAQSMRTPYTPPQLDWSKVHAAH
jgi:hypothetical protein